MYYIKQNNGTDRPPMIGMAKTKKQAIIKALELTKTGISGAMVYNAKGSMVYNAAWRYPEDKALIGE